MSSKQKTSMHFQLKLLDIPDTELEIVMKMALVQNCISGIRGKAIFGLIPKPLIEPDDEKTALPANALTMDVYTSFENMNESAQQAHLQELKQHIQYQWSRLYNNRHQSGLLKMTAPPRRVCTPPKVGFDSYRWKQLLRDSALLCQAEDVDNCVKTGLMHVKGMNLQLFYEDAVPDVFEIRVDLGPIPEKLEPIHIHKTMLTHNHVEGDESGIRWGLHPRGDRVVMAIEHQLSTSTKYFSPPTAHDLAELIKHSANESGKLWASISQGMKQICPA